uniref:Uncharacterized protein n=1 Tax=Rhizophagus irregularis (strain DAOM 181602 / DAOM 197198 / MUCL 43194) TaxID=747089 RepID=U9TQV3_RHIID
MVSQQGCLINAHLNPDDDLRIEFVNNTLGNLIEDSLEEGNEKENDEEEILMEETGPAAEAGKIIDNMCN